MQGVASFSLLVVRSVIFLSVICLGVLPEYCLYGQTALQNDSNSQESWFITTLNENRIGYKYTKETTFKQDDLKFYKTEILEHISVRRFGQLVDATSKLTITENEHGMIQVFNQSITTNGKGTITSSGKLSGGGLNTETTVAGKTQISSLNLPRFTVGPQYPVRYMRTLDLKTSVPMQFNIFEPTTMTTSSVKFNLQGEVNHRLYDQKEHTLYKINILQQNIPGHKSYYLLDKNGEIQLMYSESPLGKEISYRVSRNVALEKLKGKELDLSLASMFPVNPPLKLGQQAKAITYRITVPDGALDWKFSNTPAHQLKVVNPKTLELKTSKVLLPTFAAAEKPVKITDELSDCLKSTLFIQSDSESVRRLANDSAVAGINPAQISRLQEKFLFSKMSKNDFSSNLGSAKEAAESLKGDCTEHAVLLCGMLRAKNIPARVVIGLVYLDTYKSFAGHMWTEAYIDGTWYSLDATQGIGGISSTYIKVADTPLLDTTPAPVSLLGPLLNIPSSMKIEVIKEE